MLSLLERGRIVDWPTELIPICPEDGSSVTTDLRADDSYVEDEGWHRTSGALPKANRGAKYLHRCRYR